MRGRSTTIDRSPDIPEVSRRNVLRTAALGAAVVGTGATSVIFGATAAGASARFAPKDPDLHLLQRATWGASPASLAEIRRVGAGGWLERQLKPASINDSECDDLIAQRFPRLAWSITDAAGSLDFGWDLMFDLGTATLARAAWSERQLLEVMVDFWSNHLNITNPSDSVWATRHDWDRTVIRKHAMGRFSDMLAASATHPAMMTYLNNAESTKDYPNENYGRELLELHSVGVDGGYGEAEMYDSTLIMTGFGIDWDTQLFHYYPEWHHTGPVKILGWSSRNAGANGLTTGLSYVRYLARHPKTARRIADKLVARFVSDTPQPVLAKQLAHTYLVNDTAIVPVLRQLFRSKAFAASISAKIRRPMQDVIGTVRVLGIQPDANGNEGMQALYWMIGDLGDAPMAWASPDGYPDDSDAWRSAGGSLGRWNVHMSLAAHWWPTALRLPDLRKRLLPQALPATHGKMIDALAKKLVFRTLSSDHRNAILGFLGVEGGTPLGPDDDAVGWRLPYVVSLILDSPYFQVR